MVCTKAKGIREQDKIGNATAVRQAGRQHGNNEARAEPACVRRALGLLCEEYSFKYFKGMGVGSRCDIRVAF